MHAVWLRANELSYNTTVLHTQHVCENESVSTFAEPSHPCHHAMLLVIREILAQLLTYFLQETANKLERELEIWKNRAMRDAVQRLREAYMSDHLYVCRRSWESKKHW